MKQSKILSIILQILSIVIYIAAGIVIVILSGNKEIFDKSVLGWVLIATAIIRAIRALIEKHTITEKPYELTLPMINLGFGFVVLFANLEMQLICLYWGIIEICASSIEMTMAFRIIKRNLISILNVLINVVEFVFGILLCVHLEEGIAIHLVITGALFIAIAIEEIILLILDMRAEKKLDGAKN